MRAPPRIRTPSILTWTVTETNEESTGRCCTHLTAAVSIGQGVHALVVLTMEGNSGVITLE